jgi:hypothetical protein
VTDHAWKSFERAVALLFNGRRFWANSGETIDVEGPTVVAQCKHVARMSLEELTQLAEVSEKQGILKQKCGVVAVKVRRGHGRKSPLLVVMTSEMWRYMHGPTAEVHHHHEEEEP